jgi:hypothetical protein
VAVAVAVTVVVVVIVVVKVGVTVLYNGERGVNIYGVLLYIDVRMRVEGGKKRGKGQRWGTLVILT